VFHDCAAIQYFFDFIVPDQLILGIIYFPFSHPEIEGMKERIGSAGGRVLGKKKQGKGKNEKDGKKTDAILHDFFFLKYLLPQDGLRD